MLDKQFKIFSFLILLFMILCFLYSKNNSLLLSGGNLQKKIELASEARDEAIDAPVKAQTEFDTVNLNDASTDVQKTAAQKNLNDANKAVSIAESALNEAQRQINTCTIDLKEVYDATDTLKDLKNRINTCGDSVEFTNPLKNEMPQDDSDVNIDELTKSAADNQADY